MVAFLAVMAWDGQLRPEHVLVALLIVACFAGAPARRFAVLLMPMCLIGLLYDVQKVWPIELPVHVEGPYLVERALFGIPTAHGRVAPNELFLSWHPAALDVLCAFPYLTYIFEALALFGYFFVTDPQRCWRFGWTFFAVSLAGLLTNVLVPVAPPWYVAAHGLGPVARGVASSPAAALRFDALTGTHVFATLYARASDVFGAMPSLHAAYPLVVALAVRGLGRPRLAVFAWGYMALMCFAAVYLQHHYAIDVVCGLAYALAGHAIVTRVIAIRAAPETKKKRELDASSLAEKTI
jgi:hypothetical protein